MGNEIRVPVVTRHFFQGAAWAIVLSAFCWAILGAAYYGFASHLVNGVTSVTVASTALPSANPLLR